VNPISVLVGDFDKDGAMDLAVGDNNFPQGVSVLLGNGDGTFQSATHYQTQHGPRSGIVADMNLDGNLDLAFAPYDGTGAVGVYIFIGNGDGTFQPEVSYRAGAGANSVNGADFNGDGLLDLAVANVESNNVSVLLGQGDGTFQTHVDYGTGSSPVQVAIGDFNGDGRLDLAIANGTSNTISILLQGTTVNQNCLPPPPGLVSWWSGDRTAEDVQGTNPGVLLGGTSFRPGKVGPGFVFDGVNDWVRIPNSPSLSQTRITLDAWVYVTGKQGTHRHIISKDNVFREREYSLAVFDTDKFACFVQLPSGIVVLVGTTSMQLDTWYHVAMTHNGAKLRLYVNGVLDGVLDAVGDVVPTSNPVGIGGNAVADVFFPGIIDEAQIFSRALTDAEMLAIYQAGAAGQCKPEIFVSSITPSYTVTHSEYLAATSVAIQDENGIGISDATVNLKTLFPNGSELIVRTTTDENGNASFSFYTSETGQYKFKVAHVSHPVRHYNVSLNIQTTDRLLIP
jgi:Concanavalin A-like lectin/glucanases superfamily/FG-GAP-like repeat